MFHHLHAFFLIEIKSSESNLEHCGNFCLAPLRYLLLGRKFKQIDQSFISFQDNKKELPIQKMIKSILAFFFLFQGIFIGSCLKALSFTHKKVRVQHSLFAACLNKKIAKKIIIYNEEKKALEIKFIKENLPVEKISPIIRKKGFQISSIFFHHCISKNITLFFESSFNFKHVQHINFLYCNYNNNLFDKLYRYFPTLKKINSFHCQLSPVNKFWQKSQKKFILENNNNINDNEIMALTKNSDFKISHLILKDCKNISETSLKEISNKTSKELKEIIIKNCEQIRLDSICDLMENASLESLELSHFQEENVQAVDRFFLSLKKMSQLKKLNLAHLNLRVCKRHILQLKSLRQLETLTLENFIICNIEDLFASLKNLKNINLRGCSSVNLQLLERILKNCKNLEYLDVRDCPLLNRDDLNKFCFEAHSIKNIII